MRSRPHTRRRLTFRMLETLETRTLMTLPGVLTVALNKDLDQFGDQVVTVQGFETSGGVSAAGAGFGIFDTGASAVTFSPDDAATFDFFGNPIPIKNPGGAQAEGIGGAITGDVSEPVTIVADGLHASSLTFDKDGFPQFGFDFSGAANTDGIQAFVGTEAGSPELPTITGTPILEPSGNHPDGLAAKVDMQGQVLDFSDIAPGLVLPFPDVHFVAPSAATLDTVDGVTAPATIDLHPYGPDNFADPGDQITSAPNVVIHDVAAAYALDTSSATVDHKQFLFDTGAQISVISTATATALGLDLAHPETTITVQGVGGSQDVAGYTLARLDVPRRDGGLIEFTDIPVYVLDVADDIDGILGMNAFNTAYQFAFNPYDPTGASLSVSYLVDPNRSDPGTIDDGSGDGNLLFNAGVLFGGALHGQALPTFAPQGVRSITQVSLAPDSSAAVFSQDVSLKAAVTSAGSVPGGEVTFLDGTTPLGTATLDATGHATLTTHALGVGSHAITASYAGTPAFRAGTSAAQTVVVSRDGADVSLAPEGAPSQGAPLVLDVIVAAAKPGTGTPTGSVTITEGATTLGSTTLDATGKATIQAAATTAGVHSFTAHYAGDSGFSTGTGTIDVTVSRARPTVGLSVTGVPPSFGSSAPLSATVLSGVGTPTGQVTFLDGGQPLGTATLNAQGRADLATSDLTRVVGVHQVSVLYSGDATFMSVASPAAPVAVSRAETTTRLETSAASAPKGQAVTFRAIVSLTDVAAVPATGTVAFLDGATPLGTAALIDGRAMIALTSLAPGSHAISASFSGDAHGNPSSAPTITETITETTTPGPTATTTDLQVGDGPIVFGQAIHLKAAVSSPAGAPPTGQVAFFDGSNLVGTAPLAAGVATLDAALAGDPSTHLLTARYQGDASSRPSDSAAVAATVAPADSRTTLALSAGGSGKRKGKASGAILTVTVGPIAPGAGQPTGQVTLRIGSTSRTLTLDRGSARLTLTARQARSRAAIVATYEGDLRFRSSQSITIKASRPAKPKQR